MKNNKVVIISMVALFVTLACVLGVMLSNNIKVSANSDSMTPVFNTPTGDPWGDLKRNTTLTDEQIKELRYLLNVTGDNSWCSTAYK